jgi:hypothetical protein
VSGGGQEASAKAAVDDLRASVGKLEDVMEDAGIDANGPLGVVLEVVGEGLMRLASLVQRCEEGVNRAVSDARAATEGDLNRLRAGVTAAEIALNQARTTHTILEVQRETLVSRMIGDIAPRIAAGLKDLLVIRERRFNRNVEWGRRAAVCAVAIALVLAGYVGRGVQDSDATEALARCGKAVVVDSASGQKYCPLEALLPR